MRKLFIICFFTIIPFLTFSSLLNATQVKGDRHVIVAEDEVVEGDLYTFSETVTIDGIVTGDLISFCKSAYINGTVKGDIIAFAESVELRGMAEDDFRVFARNIIVNGTIKKNVTAFCEIFSLNQESIVEQDVLFGCAQANLRGNILGSIAGGAGFVNLTGEVGQDVDLSGDSINISSTAHIKGDLKICCSRETNIDPEALIEGEIEKVPPKEKAKSKWAKPSFYIFKLIWLIAAIVIGVLAIKLMPKLTQIIIGEAQQYWKSLGIGFVFLIFTPIASIIVIITFIGLPLGLLSLTLYTALLYLSTIFVGIVAGMFILRWLNKPFEVSLIALIIGLLALHILFQVPYLGMVVHIVTLILGLGMIVSGGFKFLREAA